MRTLTIAVALLASTAASAQRGAPALGRDLVVGRQTYTPQVRLDLDQPLEPQPDVYRQLALDWRAGPLQVGPYPAAAFAARQEGDVGVSLTIDASGRLTACSVAVPSGIAALDGHACPHLLARARFHPGLDAGGTRIGGTLPARLRYILLPRVETLAGGSDERSLRRGPRPPAPITLESLGIDPRTAPPADVYGVGASLAVDAAGAVTACTLHSPTYDDAIDKRACDRLLALRFEPALDMDGSPTASRYGFGVEWPAPRR
ncbi:MAG TPA: TonB family protein [Allosphingosinicella sp.]|jgi:TonB family protein